MKVLVVDDHEILRKGLIRLLSDIYKDAQFTEASDGAKAVSILSQEIFDVALIDINMPKLTGIEVVKQAKTSGISTPILLLSNMPEDVFGVRALKAGAQGYLNKDSDTETLFKAVTKVLKGKKYISDKIAEILAETIGDKKVDNLHELLSDRELQVLQGLVTGVSITEIGKEIGISVNTISTYRSRILQKLNLTNNASLVRYAIENNLN